MDDNHENEEEKSSLENIGETIQKHRSRNVHRNHNPKVIKNVVDNKLVKKNQPLPTKNVSMPKPNLDSEDINFDGNGSSDDAKLPINAAGVITQGISLFSKKTWIIVIVASVLIIFLLFIISMLFLVQNSSSLNYVSGNFYDNTEYQRLYQEIESVSAQYQANYGVKINKYLIISVLTSYKDNSAYVQDTSSGFFDYLEDLDNKTKASAMIETLAKYQLKTITSCSKESNTMRQIASNDDSLNITNFWTSELSREKNYDCSGSSSDVTYEISTEIGDLSDENSGSVFYWNLIDEGFFKEYYPDYFGKLSGESYEKAAAEAIEYMYLYAETLQEYDTTTANIPERNLYWWPIGSSETTEVDGHILASGDPVEYTIVSEYTNSGGLEITASGDDVNIIAVKAGTVIYPTDTTQISYPNSEEIDTENELGNYVVIEHSDGSYTLYAHLSPNTVNVVSGDSVEQGQVIGKMGSSGATDTQKLRFEVRVGGNETKNRVNPKEYVDVDNPRYMGGDFSLTSTSLSQTEFVALMNWYCISSGNSAFCENFANHADEVYQVSLENNVNPELVVVTAGTEQGWKKCAGLYNFWGIGIPNGKTCSDGPQLTSLEAGIKSYAATINSYLEGGSYASSITNRYNERLSAGCDPAGYGLPGTLAGMQSVYSWVGNYRYDPGDWGLGGCVYLDIIYGKGYCDKVTTCKDKSNCPAASRTTTCEQSDYTAWQLEGKINLRQKIFGL